MPLHVQHLGYLFAVVVAVAESDLTGLGTLEERGHVMVPGVADAAVYLNPGKSCLLVRLAAPGLGHGGSNCNIRVVFHDCPRSVVDDGRGPLHRHGDVGELVLDSLEAPEGAPESNPRL